MGCDIHAYIEYEDFKTREGEWFISCFGHPRLGRNYTLFALMAGVRYDPRIDNYQPLFAPRGIPVGPLSYEVKDNLLLVVNDKGAEEGWSNYISVEQAQNWIERGRSDRYDETHIIAPDWHSVSWLTTPELEQVKAVYETIEFYQHSWFQFDPPEKQPVPEGAVVRELERRYPSIFGSGDTEWFVGVGEPKTMPFPRPYAAVLAAMKTLEEGNEGKARLTFWFDN